MLRSEICGRRREQRQLCGQNRDPLDRNSDFILGVESQRLTTFQRDCALAHSICHNLPMCGRYRLSRRKPLVEEYFDSVPWDDDWDPRYNIAPTQPVPVVRQHPTEPVRKLSLMKWALIPYCRKTPLAQRA